MVEWQTPSNLSVPQAVYEDSKDEDLDVYRARYVEPSNTLRVRDAQRYIEESLVGLSGSLLVVGAGHSDHCNTFSRECPDLKVISSDIVEEAKEGLDEGVSFIHLDLLEPNVAENTFDYVFSAHTLEHFYRDPLFDVVWPNLVMMASKAVITVVPYGNAWEDEPTHKCKFFEDDEFAAMQDKYKIIFNGQEIVFWRGIT